MRSITKMAMVGLGVGLAVAVAARDSAVGRALRRGAGQLGRHARHSAGQFEGLRYRLGGRTPSPDVDDDVLSDRIRSELGPLEKQLDVPRVHVMVEDHVAVLHGEVPTTGDRSRIEWAVLDVPGVLGIESYLHIGLLSGSTRPSEGRAVSAVMPSPAMRALLDAAHHAGASEDDAALAVRAVVATFAERIPRGERDQMLLHLPEDVRALASLPRREGDLVHRERTVAELVAAAIGRHGLGEEHARRVTESVLGQLRQLVPEEVADVAAVLPEELRSLWTTAVPG